MSLTELSLCLAAVAFALAWGWLDTRAGAWLSRWTARLRPLRDRSIGELVVGLAVVYAPAIWLSPRLPVSRLVGIGGFLLALLLLLTRRSQAVSPDPRRITLVGGLYALAVALPFALLVVWLGQVASG